MRSLFIVNTVYQLLMAINMRMHGIPEGDADIAVSDQTPSLRLRTAALEESGLFSRALVLGNGAFNDRFWKQYNQGQRAAAFRNAASSLASTHDHAGLDLSAYDGLFFSNLDTYVKHVHRVAPDLEVHVFEDGAGTCSVDFDPRPPGYLPGFSDIYSRINELWLYQPEAMQSDVSFPMRRLPVINRRMKSTVETFNQVFGIAPTRIRFAPFVYVDQSYQADGIRNNSLRLLQETSRIVGHDALQIKSHPRNPAPKSIELGLGRLLDFDVPFEVLYLNADPSGTTFISVSSGSQLSPYVVFGERPETIFLYRAIRGPINLPQLNSKFVKYMDSFASTYASDELIVPSSLSEYRYALHSILERDAR